MKPKARLAPALLALLLAACGSPGLEGNWSVDVNATLKQAKTDGILPLVEKTVRENYAGGRLEITQDALIFRKDGNDALAVNYRILDEADGCYNLAITRSPARHKYCVSGDRLTVDESSTPLTTVFRRD